MKSRRWFITVSVLALVMAGCGDDEDTDPQSGAGGAQSMGNGPGGNMQVDAGMGNGAGSGGYMSAIPADTASCQRPDEFQWFCWDGHPSNGECAGTISFTECHPIDDGCVASDPGGPNTEVTYHKFRLENGTDFYSDNYGVDSECSALQNSGNNPLLTTMSGCSRLGPGGPTELLPSAGGIVRDNLGEVPGVWTTHWEGSQGANSCGSLCRWNGVWKHYPFDQCFGNRGNGSFQYTGCGPSGGCLMGSAGCQGVRLDYASSDCTGAATESVYPTATEDQDGDGCYQERGTAQGDYQNWDLEFGCVPEGSGSSINPSTAPNFILIIADDMGIGNDAADIYKTYINGFAGRTSEGPNSTPGYESILSTGTAFTNAWSSNTCSPSRSNLLTGQYNFRTGIGAAIGNQDPGLSSESQTFLEVLGASGYATGCFGKWHVSKGAAYGGNEAGQDYERYEHPGLLGCDTYSGYFNGALSGNSSYDSWQKTQNGQDVGVQNTYITQTFVDEATEWANAQSKPWFMWLALVAPHTPFHVPADAFLEGYDSTVNDASSDQEKLRAMVYSVYRALDMVLANIDPAELENTYVIFVGDNGPTRATALPYDNNKVKGSVNNGAIHVPFVISGPGITARSSNAMAHFVDMYPTVLDLAGIPVPADSTNIDGISLEPLLTGGTVERDYILSETFGGMVENRIAVQNGAHKLIYTCGNGQTSFYAIGDEFESSPVESDSTLTNAVLDLNSAGFAGEDYQTVLSNVCSRY